MAPRPAWKGYLKLSLVTCAVTLTPATTAIAPSASVMFTVMVMSWKAVARVNVDCVVVLDEIVTIRMRVMKPDAEADAWYVPG